MLDRNAKARRFYELLGAQAEESKVSTPPDGGSVLGWRYVWMSLDKLLTYAED